MDAVLVSSRVHRSGQHGPSRVRSGLLTSGALHGAQPYHLLVRARHPRPVQRRPHDV